MTVELSRIPQIVSGVEMMLEWKPIEEDNWKHHPEGMVLCTLLAGCAHQKYYLERMLPPDGPLHCYFTLLLAWVEWEGPDDHTWGTEVQLILSAILSGMELTEKSYHTKLDSALLADLEPAYRKLVQVIHATPSLNAFSPCRTVSTHPLNPSIVVLLVQVIGNDASRLTPMDEIPSEFFLGMTGVVNHVKLHFAGAALRELAACLRAKKIFPSLDLSPLRELGHYHQKEIERVLRQIGYKYREYLKDEIRVLASIVMV